MTNPMTLLDKLWASHEIQTLEDGLAQLWVDRHWVHEGSHHGFARLSERALPVAEPKLTFGVVDHYAPTRFQKEQSGDIVRMIATLRENAKSHGFRLFDLRDPGQGIVHVIGPEHGLTLPGLLINCGDSHTATHGAFGALAFGIGATEVAHVLATQTILQVKPLSMRLTVDGALALGVTAKDIALNWISKFGSDKARGYAIEYAGTTIRDLSMEGRMTLCNLSIEGGARIGLVAPDETTFAYLKDLPFAPKGQDWEDAIQSWVDLRTDADAKFDQELRLDAADIAPTVTWGTSPDQAVPIDATIPSPDGLDVHASKEVKASLDYMGLSPGRPIAGTHVDEVFIGSCTNGRIEDLRSAAAVLKGRVSKVPGLVSPGSMQVKHQAEAEGLSDIFMRAGLEWAAPGCSMCVGMNGDRVDTGKRCASSTNRNFRGRQGPGARTHLMSPAMVAAAAVTGTISDVRDILKGQTL